MPGVDDLEKLFQDLAFQLFDPNGPGISIALSHRGRVLSVVTRGLASVEEGVKVTGATLLDTASTSKVVTGGTVLDLIRRGSIGLDDPVHLHLPVLRGHPRISSLTIRHLLTHRSGLVDYLEVCEPTALASLRLHEIPPLAMVEDSAQAVTSEYAYSNTNYALLALVVEAVSGRSIVEHANRKLAGIAGAGFALPSPFLSSAARGYRSEALSFREPIPDGLECGVYGDGGLWCTPSTLARYLDALVQGGEGPTFEEAFEACLLPGRPAYSFGLVREAPPGGASMYAHDGAWPGFSAVVVHHEPRSLSLAVCSNLANAPVGEFVVAMRNRLGS